MRPADDEMFTMRPYCCACIAGSTALMKRKGRGEVHLEGFAPFIGVEFWKTRGLRQRRVVHENVDAAKPFQCAPCDFFRLSRGGHIARHRKGSITERVRDFFGAVDVADVHRNRRPALIQSLRRGAPEAACRTGDDRDTPLEVSGQAG